MDAVEFLKNKKIMCKAIACSSCKLSYFNNGSGQSCTIFIEDNPIKAVEEVEKWSKSHPRKTILDDFREKYPNAPLDEEGRLPNICPTDLGFEKHKECANSFGGEACRECWSIPIEV